MSVAIKFLTNTQTAKAQGLCVSSRTQARPASWMKTLSNYLPEFQQISREKKRWFKRHFKVVSTNRHMWILFRSYYKMSKKKNNCKFEIVEIGHCPVETGHLIILRKYSFLWWVYNFLWWLHNFKKSSYTLEVHIRIFMD